MPTVNIGPLTLHTNAIGWQPAMVTAFGNGQAQGLSYPATVTATAGLEIDLAVFMSDEGEGMVHCPTPGGVPPAYARLAHGARLGVYAINEQQWVIKQWRLLRFSPTVGWGNPSQTTLSELDDLMDGSVEELLQDLGLEAIGTRKEILGSKGNDLALLWNPQVGPELPMVAYTLTRILPIFKVLSS